MLSVEFPEPKEAFFVKKKWNILLIATMLCGMWSGTVGAQPADMESMPGLAAVGDSAATPPTFKAMDAESVSPSDLNSASSQDNIVPNQVLVKYKEGTSSASSLYSASSQIETKSLEADELPGAVKLELPTGSNVYQTIKELHTNPDVAYAQPVYIYKQSATVPGVVYGNDLQTEQWGITVAHLESLWGKVPVEKRSPVKIAIVDSGVDMNHADLKDSLIEGANFVNSSSAPNDDSGHGTHVAGIAAAITNNNLGIAGVAGGAKIMPIKVTNSEGVGDTRSIGQGIIWAADHGAKTSTRIYRTPFNMPKGKGPSS
jgi:subtilisin family serine protease